MGVSLFQQNHTKMKKYLIKYSGVNQSLNSRLLNNPQEAAANTPREAVEEYYRSFKAEGYWPDEDGNIFDADGDLICAKDDDEIYFDGGYIRAVEIPF
jgi:hypothetical protein